MAHIGPPIYEDPEFLSLARSVTSVLQIRWLLEVESLSSRNPLGFRGLGV